MRSPEVVTLSQDGSTIAVGNEERALVQLPSAAFVSLAVPALAELHLTGDGQYLIGLNGAGQGEIVRVSDGGVVQHLSDALSATVGTGSEVAFEGDAGVDIDWLGTKATVHLSRDELQTSAGMTRRSCWTPTWPGPTTAACSSTAQETGY